MEKQVERNRTSSLQNKNQSSKNLDRTFEYQLSEFQKTPKAHANLRKDLRVIDYQNDFNTLNNSMKQGNDIPLYEDEPFEGRNLPRHQVERETPDIDLAQSLDLDPTWFTRNCISDEPKVNLTPFSKGSSATQLASEMDTMPSTVGSTPLQSKQSDSFPQPLHAQAHHTHDEVVQKQAHDAFDTDPIQQTKSLRNPVPLEDCNYPSHFEQRELRNSLRTPDKTSNEDRTNLNRHKNTKQDIFGFDNPNALARKPQTFEKQTPPLHSEKKNNTSLDSETCSNKKFVKQNISIFFLTLLDASILLVVAFYLMNSFNLFKLQITSTIIPDIVLFIALIALSISYLTAGVHTGYTILKKSIHTLGPIVKVLLSPLLLILYLLIGSICEIPYLILTSIKAGNDLY